MNDKAFVSSKSDTEMYRLPRSSRGNILLIRVIIPEIEVLDLWKVSGVEGYGSETHNPKVIYLKLNTYSS